MPRKSLDELEAKPVEEKKPDAVVVASEDKTTRKVKLDLEKTHLFNSQNLSILE